MHIYKTSLNGNPNVGLYAYANDSYCLVGKDVPDSKVKEIKKVLKVPVHRINICGTSMLGVFLAGNNNCLLVPNICFDTELAALDKLKIKYEIVESKLTALGNNILCNDEGAMVNPEFSAKAKKQIRQALGVALKPGTIADAETVGSVAAINDAGCALHRDVSEADTDFLKTIFDITLEGTTINMGNPYIKSGVICNNNGFVVGDMSSGFEITHLDEILGFLKK